MQPVDLVKNSLRAAYETVLQGGESLKVLSGHQRDITTKADIDAGRAILRTIKKYSVPLVVYSEESGKTKLGAEPEQSVVYDDIDGTLNFRDGFGMLPHGSILGVFERPIPRFKDCLASGFLEFNSGNLFYAERGEGTHLMEGWTKGNKKEKQIKTSGRTTMEGKNPLIIVPDLYMLGNLGQYFVKYSSRAWLKDFGSSATHLVLVASRSIDIFIIADNCHIPEKRKTGEELGPGYLLVKEAGGAILDWNGNDIGDEEIGIDKNRTFHAVIASTEKLGQEFIKEIHNIPEIVKYMKRKQLL